MKCEKDLYNQCTLIYNVIKIRKGNHTNSYLGQWDGQTARRESTMTFTTLPQVAHFIQRTHFSFAGTFTDNALTILGQMNASISSTPAMIGATFEGYTDYDHGELNTLITINKLPEGGWEYTEVVAE